MTRCDEGIIASYMYDLQQHADAANRINKEK
jgi:hypothetical protein